MRGYRETMNLVTTGNVAISVSTCIVGLLLLAPRTNIMAAARFTITMMRRRTPDAVIYEPSVDEREVVMVPEPAPVRELVDA